MGAIEALEALDIDLVDRSKLSKILDHRHTGSVSVVEVLNGLQRLRGQPKRSDTISLELTIEGMQEEMMRHYGETKQIHEELEEELCMTAAIEGFLQTGSFEEDAN